MELDPNDADNNGNYAQLLLISSEKEKAANYIQVAFDNATDNDSLLLELWYYRYAHFPEYLEEAEKEIEDLLTKGVKSIGWNFEGNIEQAIKDKHPDIEKLKDFAKRITNE